MNKKVKKIVKENDAANSALMQMGLMLGIYQSVVGDLPGNVIMETQAALNPAMVFTNLQQYIDHVRDTAARLAQAAQEKRDQKANPIAGETLATTASNPYSVLNAGQGSQQASPDTGTALGAPPQRSLIWSPPSRS